MERELPEFLRAAVEADEMALGGARADGPLGRAVREVRRRRRVRAAQQAALGVAAVGVLGAAVLAGGQWRHDPSPATPAPTSTSTPTPTPGPTSSPTPTLGPVIDEAGLPPFRELTPGVLATARAGWVLAGYETGPSTAGSAPGVVLVVTLDGDAYRVPGITSASVTIAYWEAGTTSAVVTRHTAGGQGVRAVLDLGTGATRDEPRGLPATAEFVGLGAGGREVWVADRWAGSPTTWLVGPAAADGVRAAEGLPSAVSPDGRTVVLGGPEGDLAAARLLDVPTGTLGEQVAVRRGADQCRFAAWLRPTAFLVDCVDADGIGDATLLADIAGDPSVSVAAVGAFGTPGPRADGTTWLADGVAAGALAESAGPDSCFAQAVTWDSTARPTTLQAAAGGQNQFEVKASAGLAYVHAKPGCSGDAAPGTLTLHDVGAGASRILLPLPTTPVEHQHGVTSWAIAY